MGEVLVQRGQRDVGELSTGMPVLIRRSALPGNPALRRARERLFLIAQLGQDPGLEERLDQRRRACPRLWAAVGPERRHAWQPGGRHLQACRRPPAPAHTARRSAHHWATALLSEALELWRGPALAEVAFEDFAQAEIRRMEELRLVAPEARIDADLQLGRYAQPIGEIERCSPRSRCVRASPPS